MKALTPNQLRNFEPFNGLQDNRVAELAKYSLIEAVPAGAYPFSQNAGSGQSVYLISGEIAFETASGTPLVIHAGDKAARHPLPIPGVKSELRSARTVVASELTRIDSNLIDIMLTWEQIAAADAAESGEGPVADKDSTATLSDTGATPQAVDDSDWQTLTGAFSAESLATGTFAALPPAHISQLLGRFESLPVTRGQVILREGDDGDYYYVINTGRAEVTRMVGGVSVTLATLKSGAAFGEEALISDTKRNATVTMVTNGSLLRLAKRDFIELLQAPLLNQIDHAEAVQRISRGARWIDVRFPSEFQHDKMPGAINIPLNELRHAFAGLDRDREYIVYCQSGRRSGAAAFLLAQRGFRAAVLQGGLWRARGAS